MKTHKSGYEIRAEVLKVAADICKQRYKDHNSYLTNANIIETAKKLYAFVENKGEDNDAK